MSIQRKACFIFCIHSRLYCWKPLLTLTHRNLSQIGSGGILAINSFQRGFQRVDVKKDHTENKSYPRTLGFGVAGKTRQNPRGGTADTEQCGPSGLWTCPQVTWMAGGSLLGASLLAGRANLCYSAFSYGGSAEPCSMIGLHTGLIHAQASSTVSELARKQRKPTCECH